MSEVPNLPVFRKAVDDIPEKRDAMLIKVLYLNASRISEVLTRICPSDEGLTHPYGTRMTWELMKYQDEHVLLIKTMVAKRKEDIFKIVALPCDPKYEPWTLDLLRYLKKEKRRNLNFDITRQWAGDIFRLWLGKFYRSNPKRILNPWRHWRLTHLVEIFGFDPYDLCVYSGWTFKHGISGSGQLDTYLHLDWRRYFPKLLKPMKLSIPAV